MGEDNLLFCVSYTKTVVLLSILNLVQNYHASKSVWEDMDNVLVLFFCLFFNKEGISLSEIPLCFLYCPLNILSC